MKGVTQKRLIEHRCREHPANVLGDRQHDRTARPDYQHTQYFESQFSDRICSVPIGPYRISL